MKPRTFVTIWGTELQLSQNGLLASLGLWFILALLGWQFLQMTAGTAVFFGLISTLLHWVVTFSHHLGHVFAARRTGYPMLTVRMVFLLATERYPKNEPSLPAEIHIRRALGGPLASLLLSLVSLLLVWLLQSNEFAYYLALFFLLDNFLVYFLGSFCPWALPTAAPCSIGGPGAANQPDISMLAITTQ